MCATAIVVLVVYGAVDYLLFGSSLSAVSRFYTGNIMLEFFMGMALAVMYLKGRLPPQREITAAILVVAAFTFVVSVSNWDSLSHFRGLVWGPAAFLIVLCMLNLEFVFSRLHLNWLKRIGDASYTIYLMHLFPLSALRLVWDKLDIPNDTFFAQIAFQGIALPGISLLGYFAYKWLEIPLRSVVTKRVRR